MMDPFRGALTDSAQLRELYAEPDARVVRKDIGRVDELCRRLIAASPMVLIGSAGAGAQCDVTPRGGPPGFVTPLDETHLAIPDATGNRRLDTLRNIVESGRAGLLFLIPGRSTTLRVNGRACVTADPELLAAIGAVGKPPRSAIVIAAEEVYTHCPKAFIRSGLWNPESWPNPDDLPTSAEVTFAHQADRALTLEQVEQLERESIRERLA